MSWLLQYLLNSLWQIPLLAVAGLLTARLLRGCGPAAEHRAWVLVLGAQIVLPACSFDPLPWLRSLLSLADPHPANAGQVTIQIGPGLKLGVGMLPSGLVAAAVAAYSVVTLYFATKLLLGLWQTRTLRHSALPVSLPEDAERFLSRCLVHFGVREAEILSSPQALGPLTLGLRRPAILLPAGMIDRITPAEFEAVLAHEFAHIGRHDYAKNLLYEALAVPLRFHPAFRLTRNRIVETREILCDQLGAALLPSPQVYARSLVRLAALLLQGRQVRVAHAIGIFDAHSFERRVMQLTRVSSPTRGLRAAALLVAAATFGLGTCASALALRATLLPASNPMPQQTGAPRSAALQIGAGVMAGNILTKVTPVYPPDAKSARIQGAVVLHAIIGKDGAVEDLTVISGPPELAGSALDAVSKWVYKPYLLNGEPTEVETTITVNYRMGN